MLAVPSMGARLSTSAAVALAIAGTGEAFNVQSPLMKGGTPAASCVSLFSAASCVCCAVRGRRPVPRKGDPAPWRIACCWAPTTVAGTDSVLDHAAPHMAKLSNQATASHRAPALRKCLSRYRLAEATWCSITHSAGHSFY